MSESSNKINAIRHMQPQRQKRSALGIAFALGCLCLLAPALSQASPVTTASYHIKARLDPGKKRIFGWLRLTWRNPSKVAVKALRFHLYMNAFRNEKSTFLQDLKKLGRFGGFGYRAPVGRWGWCQLKAMRVTNGPSLFAKARFISPDDGNVHDRTMLHVPLPTAVPPGGKIQVDIKFETQLPWGMFRVGYRKDYFFIGQWYPKVAVFEPKGVRGAKKARWNSHQFHATTEFYADFGNYTAELTVPSRFVVGATGARHKVQHHPKQKTTTYTYKQRGVHDYAWTASPLHKRIVRYFDPKKDVTSTQKRRWAKRLGVSVSALKLKKVKMIFMMQPEHMHQLKRHISALKTALRTYGLWLGAYPYSTITLVDPAYEGAIRAFSGMEYATLFTAGTKLNQTLHNRSLEWLIIHEYGHMYFQGIVASNEFEEPWLDEGVNTYTNTKLLRWHYADARQSPHVLHMPLSWLSLPIHYDQLPRIGYLLMGQKNDPVAQLGWKFRSGVSFGQQAYMKAALVLQNLENIVGEKKMLRAMRAYVQRWKYKHPSGEDFKRHMSTHTKRNLKPFFKQFLHKTKVMDYAVGLVTSRRIKRSRGSSLPIIPKPKHRKKPTKQKKRTATKGQDSNTKKILQRKKAASKPTSRPVQPSQPTSRKAPPKRIQKNAKKAKKPSKSRLKKLLAKASRKQAKAPRYISRVIIKRKGSAIWPVEVKMTFADKSSLIKRWDGKGLWVRFSFKSHSRLARVDIDPAQKLTLDVNLHNNSYVLRKSNKATLGWFLRLMSWIQQIFLSLIIAL